MTFRTAINAPLCAILFLLPICGCDNFVDVPTDLPYQEQLVVWGVLEPGQVVDSIQFLRTLPIGEPYSIENAIVSDVVATIRSNDSVYALRHIGGGYYTSDSLVPRSGQRYALTGRWRGTEVYGSTRVPWPVDSSSVALELLPAIETGSGSPGFRLTATFPPQTEQVYGLGYDIVSAANMRQTDHMTGRNAIVRPADSTSGGQIVVITRADYVVPGPAPLTGTAYVYTFDAPYYSFYMTFGDDEAGDRIFSSSEEKVQWTVHGDGIGIFIGRAVTQIRI